MVDDASGTSAAWARVVVVIPVGGGTGSVAAVWVESHVTHNPSADATKTTAMATPAAHPFIDEATYAAPAPRVARNHTTRTDILRHPREFPSPEPRAARCTLANRPRGRSSAG